MASASGGKKISREKAKTTAAKKGWSTATALAVCHSSEAIISDLSTRSEIKSTCCRQATYAS